LALFNLTGFLHSRRRTVFSVLFTVGAILLPYAIALLSAGWMDLTYGGRAEFMPLSRRFWAVALGVTIIAIGWFYERKTLPAAIVVATMTWTLPWARTTVTETAGGRTWPRSEPNLLAYALVASSSVFLVWWGIRNLSRALVNYGVVAFALTVMWFYFSSVMDKLDRSLGLILLGILFLAGGWALEHTRRRLIAGMGQDPMELRTGGEA
jgi:hypothetical protein